MEKSIVADLLLVILLLVGCTDMKQNNTSVCQSLTDIAVSETVNYLDMVEKDLTSNSYIVEMRVDEITDGHYQANMFLSKPYLKGQQLPIRYTNLTYKGRDVHLLVYCDYKLPSKTDSQSILKRLSKQRLVVDDVLQWTTYGEWSTQDYESLTFVFCKNDIGNYTVTSRTQMLKDEIVMPKCTN